MINFKKNHLCKEHEKVRAGLRFRRIDPFPRVVLRKELIRAKPSCAQGLRSGGGSFFVRCCVAKPTNDRSLIIITIKIPSIDTFCLNCFLIIRIYIKWGSSADNSAAQRRGFKMNYRQIPC